MKKNIGIWVLAVALFGSTPALADIEVRMIDANEDMIAICDDMGSTGNATLLIYNPGMGADHLADGDYDANSAAVQYFDAIHCAGEAAAFTVQMHTETGGVFRVELKTPERTQTTAFAFYPAAMKEDMLAAVNRAAGHAALLERYDADSGDTLLDRVMRIYSLHEFPLYADGSKIEIARALLSIRASMDGGRYPADADKLYGYLQQACLLAAYNHKDQALIYENGALRYREILGLDETAEMQTFDQSLRAEGKQLLAQRLMGQNFQTLEQLQEAFREQMLYVAIMYHRQMGYGHLDALFATYRSGYLRHGFLLDHAALTTGRKNQIYAAFMAKPADNLAQLAAAFNAALTEAESGTGQGTTGGKPSGGGGGGGGGTSGGKAPAILLPPTTQADPVPPSPLFGDLDTVPWAADAIAALADMGAINGKAAGQFAPNDQVTRAEFVKILVGAFGIQTDGAVCSFDDVQDNWCYPYVAAATANGIVNGVSDTLFGAGDAITREQGAAMLYRMAVRQGTPPDGTGQARFADDDAISVYAAEAVYALKAGGILSGRGDNLFVPAGSMTRAEAAKMIYQLLVMR